MDGVPFVLSTCSVPERGPSESDIVIFTLVLTLNGRSVASKYFQRASRAFRLSGPLSADDTAKVLHYLLLALFTWNGFWTVVLLPHSTGHPPQLTALSLIEAALAAALVKLHLGSFRAASWIYLGGVWLSPPL
jgi:hypothetical protein